jgi:hypothetical protein
MKERGPDGQCKFTPQGSCCINSAQALVSAMTIGNIKHLSGLDDTKVIKGMENFQTLRLAGKEYSGAKIDKIMKNIDKVELYYKTDFVPHLKQVADHGCNCFTCGFYDKGKSTLSNCDLNHLHRLNLFDLAVEGNPNDVVCPSKDSHKNPCEQCAKGFNIIHLLFDKVEAQLEAATPEPIRRSTRQNCVQPAAVNLLDNLSQSDAPADSQQVPPPSKL